MPRSVADRLVGGRPGSRARSAAEVARVSTGPRGLSSAGPVPAAGPPLCGTGAGFGCGRLIRWRRTGWPAAPRPRGRPLWCRSAREQGNGLAGCDFGPGSVPAPSEIVSKSACNFDCTSTTKRALASSCSSLAFLQPGDLRIPRIGGRTAARLPQPGQRPGITGTPPLGNEAGVQALPAQDRAFLTVGRPLVSGKGLLLVLRGERRGGDG